MSSKSDKKSKKKLMFKKKVNKSKLGDDKISGLKEQYKNVSFLKYIYLMYLRKNLNVLLTFYLNI